MTATALENLTRRFRTEVEGAVGRLGFAGYDFDWSFRSRWVCGASGALPFHSAG